MAPRAPLRAMKRWIWIAAGVLAIDFLVAKHRSQATAGYNQFRGVDSDLSATGFLGIRYPFV